MILFSNKSRPYHYGPYPLERIARDASVRNEELRRPRIERPAVEPLQDTVFASAVQKYHEIFHSRDTYKFALEIGKYTHARGWPGVPTGAAQTIFDQFLLPTVMAECATDRLSPEEAVKKLDSQCKRIYRRFNRRA